MTVPNAFVDIKGNRAFVRPTGVDDQANIQETIDAMTALGDGFTIILGEGVYWSSAFYKAIDSSGTVEAAAGAAKGAVVIKAGTASTAIALLSDEDSQSYDPTGIPSLFVAHPKSFERYGGTYTWDGTASVVSANATGVLPIVGDHIRLDDIPENKDGLGFEISAVAGTAPNLTLTILNPDAATIPTSTGAKQSSSVYKPSLSARDVDLHFKNITFHGGDHGRTGGMQQLVHNHISVRALVQSYGAYTRMDRQPTARQKQTTVSPSNVRFTDCAFVGGLHPISRKSNVQKGAILSGGEAWVEAAGVFSQILGFPFFDISHIDDAGYGTRVYLPDYQRPFAAQNGSASFHKCDFVDLWGGIEMIGWVEDRATDTPYVMSASAEAKPRHSVSQCTFKGIGKNHGSVNLSVLSPRMPYCVQLAHLAGSQVSVSRNKATNCRGFIRVDAGIPSPDIGGGVSLRYLPTYTASQADWSVNINEANLTANPADDQPQSLIDGFRLSEGFVIDLTFTGRPMLVVDAGHLQAVNNDITVSSDWPGAFLGGFDAVPMSVTKQMNTTITHNRFTKAPPTVANPGVENHVAIILLTGSGASMTSTYKENEFRGWVPDAVLRTIFLSSGTINCSIVMGGQGEPATTVLDLGTSNTIVGAGQDNVDPGGISAREKIPATFPVPATP